MLSKGDAVDKQVSAILSEYCSNNSFLKGVKGVNLPYQTKNSIVDEDLVTYLPILRLEPGKYLIGTKERKLIIEESILKVKEGEQLVNFYQFVQENCR